MKLDFIVTKFFVKFGNAEKKEFLEKFNCGPFKKIQSKAEILI